LKTPLNDRKKLSSFSFQPFLLFLEKRVFLSFENIKSSWRNFSKIFRTQKFSFNSLSAENQKNSQEILFSHKLVNSIFFFSTAKTQKKVFCWVSLGKHRETFLLKNFT